MTEEIEPTFEQALTQLERIVADLERGGSDLTAALGRYESGIQLLKRCHVLLDQAQQSVALLTGVDPEGNPITSTFDAAATIAREPGSAPIILTPAPSTAAIQPSFGDGLSSSSDPVPRITAKKMVRRPKNPDPLPEADAFDPPF